jgi:TRAP-type C4-dicarboxylate transport system permease small subunit
VNVGIAIASRAVVTVAAVLAVAFGVVVVQVVVRLLFCFSSITFKD